VYQRILVNTYRTSDLCIPSSAQGLCEPASLQAGGIFSQADEITEADDTACAATLGGSSLRVTRQVTPPSMPADLRTSLAMPTTFGPKLFEISTLHAVSAACKVKVKDTGDLLLLRDWLFEELGPPYMWTVMLSVVEWEHLTDDQKELHSTMRESWLSSYSKASHTVLQHWLWRFLKKQTESFAPLHKVFAKIKVDSPNSGTSAWTEIFLLYPVTGASIAHKLYLLFLQEQIKGIIILARGLKTCLNFRNDSMASALDYIDSVNASASQLRTKSFSLTSTTVTPSRSTRCNTRSSGSLVLTPHVHSRSPTPATLQFATTTALAVVTHVARHLGLRARVRPPARTPLAAPEALIVLSLPLLLLSTPTGATKASTRNTTLLLSSFRATT
jgi:hypothetical protein